MKNAYFFKSIKAFAVLLCCLFVVSCFESETSTRANNSVTEVMEQRQSTAAAFARTMQQSSAIIVQNFTEIANNQGSQFHDLWEAGSIDSVAASGMIDLSAFANLNSGRYSNMISAAYCDGVLLTWMSGEDGEQISVKGLGDGGSEAISRVLSKQLGPNAYGVVTNGHLKTSDGAFVGLGCEAARTIPEGAPVIFANLGSLDLESNGSYFEFFNEACPDGDDGFVRYRQRVNVVYDENGAEISREEADPEVFLSSCRDAIDVASISVTDNPTVSVVDFAAQTGGGAQLLNTKEVVCFEAERVDGDSGPDTGEDANRNVLSALGEQRTADRNVQEFTNCMSAQDYRGSMGDGAELDCGPHIQPDTTEIEMKECQGNGWVGDVTYEREVEYCRVIGGQDDGDIFEKKGKWERVGIDCTRDEVQNLSCPAVGGGMITYERVNRIIDPVSLAPTNPDWNFTNETCNYPDEVSCVVGHAGSTNAFARTLNGANTPPILQTTNMGDYCGSGRICTIKRGQSCPPRFETGSVTEHKNYACGSGWSSWYYDSDNCCDRDEYKISSDVCPDFYTTEEIISQDCVDEDEPTSSGSCENVGDTCTGPGSLSCSDGMKPVATYEVVERREAGSKKYVKFKQCPGNTFPGGKGDLCSNTCPSDDEEPVATCPDDPGVPTCTYGIRTFEVGETTTARENCGSGYTGNRYSQITCQSDGTWDFGSWDRSECEAEVVTCSYGGNEYEVDSYATRTQECEAGASGEITQRALCQSDGTLGDWEDVVDTCETITECELRWNPVNTYNVDGCANPPADTCGDFNGGSCENEGDSCTRVSGGGLDPSVCSDPDYNTGFGYGGEPTLEITDYFVSNMVCEEVCEVKCTFDGSTYDIGQTRQITRECAENYTGEQTATLTCQGDGSWSTPSSWDASACRLEDGYCELDGDLYETGDTVDQSRECGAYYTGEETRTIECQSDGSWTNPDYNRDECAEECRIVTVKAKWPNRGNTSGCRDSCAEIDAESTTTDEGRVCESGETGHYPGVSTFLKWSGDSLRCYTPGQVQDNNRSDKAKQCYCWKCGPMPDNGGGSGSGSGSGGGSGSGSGGREVQH